MLNNAILQNFGPIEKLIWTNLGKINLIIGDNGSGKTFLLKALYSAIRTLEEYKRGNDQRTDSEIIADKLYWTYQVEKIGDLVYKNTNDPLVLVIIFDGKAFSFAYRKDTTKNVPIIENKVPPINSNSIFLPAKEIISIHHVILKSREIDKMFGFDDTYLDLARALRQSPTAGKNYANFSKSRKHLEEMFGGKVEYDQASGRWQFKKGHQKFPIGVTAEGIKKIAILDTLLGNRYLSPSSLVFIDEPEAALHPVAISRFLDIIATLAEAGIQFFLASHSYFVVKKLFLIAQEKQISIPVISASAEGWQSSDLKDGMPDNAIINESIRLYKEEVELALR